MKKKIKKLEVVEGLYSEQKEQDPLEIELMEIKQEETIESPVEETPIQRLQKKYATQIEQTKGHYVRGLDREAIMEILRGVEKYMGRSIHLGDLSCGPCVIDLVNLLGSLK